MKTNIIIDTDPGIDDAVAIVTSFFAPSIDIKLICSTAGNLGIDITTRNVLHLCELYGQNIPVAKGLPGPLNRPLEVAFGVHGPMGFGSYTYNGVKTKEIDMPAYEAMHYAVRLNPGISILVIGPLTNVAKFLQTYPEDIKYIKQLVFMGGTKDNVLEQDEPYPEFNISRDPEACDIVLKSGVNVVIIPMDFGHYAYINKEEIRKLKSVNKTGRLFYEMYKEYKDGHVSAENAATHDSCAVSYLIEPSLFKTEYVQPEIKYYNGKGVLVSNIVNHPTNFKLAVDMDEDSFKNLYHGLVSVAKQVSE